MVHRVTREIEADLQRWKIEDSVTHQRRPYFRWAGHVAQRQDRRWSTLVLGWASEASRGRQRARPRRRWGDRLLDFFRDRGCDAWMALAMDRDEWKTHESAFLVFK